MNFEFGVFGPKLINLISKYCRSSVTIVYSSRCLESLDVISASSCLCSLSGKCILIHLINSTLQHPTCCSGKKRVHSLNRLSDFQLGLPSNLEQLTSSVNEPVVLRGSVAMLWAKLSNWEPAHMYASFSYKI